MGCGPTTLPPLAWGRSLRLEAVLLGWFRIMPVRGPSPYLADFTTPKALPK